MLRVLFLTFYLNANTVNASDKVDKPAARSPHSESQHLVFLYLIFSPERLQKDVRTDPPCAAEVSLSKCRREYDLMMVMSPTWGFWQKRMVQDEGAWAKRAQTTQTGTQSGLLCYKICYFILRTSPVLDPPDYTCWKDAYATGRLHRNLHCQPRSVWKSRYGESAHTHARAQALSLSVALLYCFAGFMLKYWRGETLNAKFVPAPFNSILVPIKALSLCIYSSYFPSHDDLKSSAAE